MRVFITVLVLIFSFQSWAKADDIRDFQIEGMSVGDSALDYFSEEEISNAIDDSDKDKIFIVKTLISKNSDPYESLQLSYNKSSQKKILHGVTGVVFFDIKKCKKEMKKIVSELSLLFPNTKKQDWGKYKMHNNEGFYYPVTFDFKDSSRVQVSCYDWKKDIQNNSLKVSLYSSEYTTYLKNKN